MRKTFAVFLSALFLNGVCSADEYWERIFHNELPSGIPYRFGVESFKGMLYLFTNTDWNKSGIYRSVRGRSWELTRYPEAKGYGCWIQEHKGQLYAADTASTPIISRSSDGLDWEQVYASPDALSGGISFDDYLYTGQVKIIEQGANFVRVAVNIIRTKGDAVPLSWETANLIPHLRVDPKGQVYYSFSVLDGVLHVAVSSIKGSAPAYPGTVHVFAMNSNGTWQLTGTLEVPVRMGHANNTPPRLFSNKGRLYINYYKNSWRTLDTSSRPYQWQEDPAFLGKNHFYAIVNEKVHAFRESGPIQFLDDQDQWQTASSERFSLGVSGYHGRDFYAFATGNPDLGSPNDLWVFRGGVVDVQNKVLPAATYYAGQKSCGVLAMSIRANSVDEIMLSIKNLGTAAEGTSIERVRLVKSMDQPGANAGAAAQFVPIANDKKSWKLETPLPVKDGDQLFVLIDIKAQPVDNDTCIFSVENMSLANGQNVTLTSPLVSSDNLTIKSIAGAPGTEPINEVLIFPSPAKDTVHLMYDLAESSDINIKIYDENGVLVSEINDPGKPAGSRQETLWNASRMAPGAYLSLIEISGAAGGKRLYKRKIYIKK